MFYNMKIYIYIYIYIICIGTSEYNQNEQNDENRVYPCALTSPQMVHV